MKKIITVILDGFGIREEVEGNAIKQAVTPNLDKLFAEYPHSLLNASGKTVGLPEGQFGNSEVGHSIIGAGRSIKQEELSIDEFFENDEMEKLDIFQEAIADINGNNKVIHLMILASDGGVHSHYKHLLKMLEKLKEYKIKKVFLHLITDGRDTDVHSSFKYIEKIKEATKSLGIGEIATLCGRYYAMDRDNNWDRIKKYYDLVTKGVGIRATDIKKTIEACYNKDITDEFLPPILLNENGIIRNNDYLIWLNFRNDRAKQILSALVNPKFDNFVTLKLNSLQLITFYEVDKNIKSKPLIETPDITNPIGKYLGDLGLTQARIAETEKFAHVTFFFDNEYNGKIEGCDHFLIPSPQVATYDMKPETSAIEVCKKAITCMEKDYDFILVNFANCDLVGHTGDMIAAIKAVQIVDLCMGKIFEAAEDNFYTIVMLGDHGNADIMLDENNNPVTTHTSSQVPFLITDKKVKLEDGNLTMVAPTILEYMDIALPKEMRETKSLFISEKNKETTDF